MGDDDVSSLRALRTLLDIVGHLVCFVQGTETVRLDGGEVYEGVVTAVILSYEAVTLLAAEPLDLAFCHDLPSLPGLLPGNLKHCQVSLGCDLSTNSAHIRDPYR